MIELNETQARLLRELDARGRSFSVSEAEEDDAMWLATYKMALYGYDFRPELIGPLPAGRSWLDAHPTEEVVKLPLRPGL